MTLDDFNAQLNNLEKTLLSYYKQKSLLISARETLRFQYVSSLKTQWNDLMSAMNQQLYNQNNSYSMELLHRIIGLIQNNIPMCDLSGNQIAGWYINPLDPSNNPSFINAGMLSPIENILSKPLFSATALDQRPAYSINGGLPYLGGISVNSMIEKYFLPTANMNYGPDFPFSIPPTIDWAIAKFQSLPIYPFIADAFPVTLSVLSKTYQAGTLQGLVNSLRETLRQIFTYTQNLVSLQNIIDSSENDLSTFVANFSSFGSTLNVSQILLDLQNAALAANNPPPAPAHAQPEVVSVIPEPIATSVVTPAPSKLPWIAAVAVLGILSMVGKKT